jgi:hypothetical protein
MERRMRGFERARPASAPAAAGMAANIARCDSPKSRNPFDISSNLQIKLPTSAETAPKGARA